MWITQGQVYILIKSDLFLTAALHGKIGVVSLLLEVCQYMIDSQDSCGSTPLMDAVRFDNIEMAQLFIKNHKVNKYLFCEVYHTL